MTPEALNTTCTTYATFQAGAAQTVNPTNLANQIHQADQIPTLCQNCSIWDHNQKLEQENTNLEQRITQLEAQNKALAQRLARYENIRKPKPLKRLRRRTQTSTTRFPGRPKGYPGTTQPRPEPQIVVDADTVKECPECGMGLEQPVYTRHRVVEELPDIEPVKVVDYHEDHYLCTKCSSVIVSRHPDCPPQRQVWKKRLRTDNPSEVRGKTPPGKSGPGALKTGAGCNRCNRARAP